MKIVNLKGERFGRLIALRLTGSSRGGSKLWECQCDCGNKVHVSTRHLNRKNNNIKSCGCLIHRKGSNHRDWKGVGEISGQWWSQRVTRTDHKRVPVEITIDKEYAWNLFLKQGRKCSLSNLPLVISINPHLGSASLDRIDSGQGYIPGNIQWVHKHINFMKNKFENNYFIELCKLVASNS